MSLTPATAYDAATVQSGELLPVEAAFAKDDFPVGLATSRVRGHVAWVKEVATTVACEPGTVMAVHTMSDEAPATPNAGESSVTNAAGAVMFAPTLNATLTWLERGYVIEIAGPYEVAQLIQLAEEMSWP